MTIQRQYNLPNCKLVVQGVGNDSLGNSSLGNSSLGSNGADQGGRTLLSMVTNVECYLAGSKTPITGGKAFLESLSQAVSQYAQGYLNGIQHLLRQDTVSAGLVQIQQVEPNVHRLTVQPEAGASAPTEVNLTTVQLFDLVEAVDQMFADGQTLPDLALKLDPITKRNVAAAEPLAKRATPLAVGLSSLAAAAALLFMLPVPEVRRPETDPAGTESSVETTPGTSTPGSSPAADSSPTQPESPSADATPTSTAPSNSDPSSPDPSSPDSANPSATRNTGIDFSNTPKITDSSELDRLTLELRDDLDLDWDQEPTFEGELVYRVGVNQRGDVVGYKYVNDAALTYRSNTPLADIQFSPTPEGGAESTPSEPIAQFRVVFKSDKVVEVSPWEGQVSAEDASTEEEPAPPDPQ